jgi:hypothetical protein
MRNDVIAAADEELDGEPLLVPAMRDGEVLRSESLEDIRGRTTAQLATVPPPLRQPAPSAEVLPYEVTYSDRLRAMIPPR